MKNRKALALLLLLLLAVLASWLGLGMATYRAQAYKALRAERIRQLPALGFPMAGGGVFDQARLRPGSPCVLVLFDPACSNCQEAARTAAAYGGRLQQLDMVWLTEAPFDSLQAFAGQHGLLGMAGMYFLSAPVGSLEHLFGKAPVPSYHVYGPDGMLLKVFRGETHPPALLKAAGLDVPPYP